MESKHSLRKSKLFRALLILLLIAVPVQWAAAQLTLSTPRTTLGTVIKQIQSQSKYQFFYNDKLSTVTVEPLKVKENLEVPEIQEQVEMIYHHLQDKYHSKPNIIYGGGVEQKDINDLLDNDFINGLLIGKISANIEKITKIITKVK